MSKTYPYTLEALPYAYDALEPVIDKQTMEIHHDKHHQGYVNKLNAALEQNSALQKKPLDELLGSEIVAVKNNAGGVWNHDFFWNVMIRPGAGKMGEAVTQALGKEFGSVDDFKAKFEAAAGARFGSGWAWLVKDSSGKLSVLSTPNQDNPLVNGLTPLLGVDVWEHAYYLKYQNRRGDYVKAWWDVVNWAKVEELLKA